MGGSGQRRIPPPRRNTRGGGDPLPLGAEAPLGVTNRGQDTPLPPVGYYTTFVTVGDQRSVCIRRTPETCEEKLERT